MREREEQYRSIFEATSDGLFITDFEDGHLIEVNPAACKMHGYSYQEFLALHPTAFIHPDSHHLFIKYLQTVKAGGQFHAQAIDVQKDGTTFPVEVYGTSFIYKEKPHVLGIVRDITERVQAEQQLREREEQYRNIFEASFDGINISTLDGPIVEANPALCRIFGYTREELLSISPAVLIHPDSLHVMSEVLQEVGAGHESLKRATCLRKDGTSLLIESRVTPFTYKGQPHLLSVTRDITERVQAEQQLREKEEEYRSIFEASIDGLLIIDQDNHIVEANPATCQIHGYTREELLGRSASSEVINVRDIIRAGGEFHTREKGVRKDGTSFHSEVRGTPFTYKGKPHMLGIVRDITEQVQAEEQLREREEQYRSIFEATSDALLIRDLEDGHVVEANPAACQMYGYSYEEFIGLDANVITHPDSLRILPEGLQTVRAGHRLQFQGLGLRKNGTPIHVEVRGTPFTYKGKPHLLGASHDITEQVQAQQLLEQRVEERTRELSTLLEVSHNVASTIDLNILLELILDQLKVVVDYAGSAITILEGEDLILVGTRGPESEEHLVQHRFPMK
ncbi:MAG TPA: PAS domain S-box protein, partial [Ktedonobacteraceae bacterium]|nr:PAS domain S-box protein [Ktedonobacteraceae bacterium]